MNARDICNLIKGADYDDVEALLDRYADDPRGQVQKTVQAVRRKHEREKAERERVLGMYELERELGGEGIVVGVDEVGRGPIAGPLTVAAVALPRTPIIWGINDSKQLTPQTRERLAAAIKETALAIGICHIPPAEIDEQGMGASLRRAMAAAIEDTGVDPDCVLIDGNPVHAHPKEKTLVKGDARIACIAAASIYAKVTRDRMMVEYDRLYPVYGFASNKGYGSAAHIAAIKEYGLSPIHRVSFCGNFMEMPTLF